MEKMIIHRKLNHVFQQQQQQSFISHLCHGQKRTVLAGIFSVDIIIPVQRIAGSQRIQQKRIEMKRK